MRIKILNSNLIKIIAVVCMVLDHLGLMLLPSIKWLRVIGRIAFPIFSYFIAEGCKYTRNKIRYFSFIFCFGVIFQLVYDIAVGVGDPFNIFLTFSLSILVICCLDYLKVAIFNKKYILEYIVLTVCIILAIVFLCNNLNFDYGIFGVLLPVFVSLPMACKNAPNLLKRLDNGYIKALFLALGICLMPFSNGLGSLLYWGLLSVPIILLYNGKRGRLNLKYLFYIVYPLHMVIIYFISLI